MFSVPARLGKGQGAKEIGHNLARANEQNSGTILCANDTKSFTRERPKFSLVGD